MLSAPWWQGVAGIAQIIAAVLSIWAIREIYKERKNSVSPDWEENKTGDYVRINPIGKSGYNIGFINTGYGIARKITVEYQANNETELSPFSQPRSSILPEHTIEVQLLWDGVLHPDGLITVSCLNRYDNKVVSFFSLTSSIDNSNRMTIAIEKITKKCIISFKLRKKLLYRNKEVKLV